MPVHRFLSNRFRAVLRAAAVMRGEPVPEIGNGHQPDEWTFSTENAGMGWPGWNQGLSSLTTKLLSRFRVQITEKTMISYCWKI
jgi:hypothetical protein